MLREKMETKQIEKIDVVSIEDISGPAREEIERKVASKPVDFRNNFKGFVEIRMVSTSPMRVESIEPIEGTEVDWFRRNKEDTEINISDIF